MATIQIHVSDDKILQYLRDDRNFSEGRSNNIQVEVEARPPVQNSKISHVVHVTVTYGLELGEIEKLAEI